MPQASKVSPKNSTIVRPYKNATAAALRHGFGTLERLAPGLGALWAERLWFARPPLPPGALAPPDGLPPGAAFELELPSGVLRGQSWGQGPNAYLVHGWGGWGLQLSGFIAPLLKAGFRVISFDMPSHGASDPGRLGARAGTLPEFAEALAAVVGAQGPAHALIAHSMGATAAASVLREGVPAAAAVFISPMADPVQYTHAFAQRFGFGEQTRARLQRRVEAVEGLPMAYYNVPRMARDRRMPPLLVVHDRADRETPWTDGEAIARAWPGARLLSTQGLGHRRILADADVIRSVTGFVQSVDVQAAPPRKADVPAARSAGATRAAVLATLLAGLWVAGAALMATPARAQEQAPEQSREVEAADAAVEPTPAVGPIDEPAEDTPAARAAQRREAQRRLRDELRGLSGYGFILPTP
ncbi:MAG TPA: alpha/beta fold hydrolase [Nevskiales bacterium]|nr:alpha/beta fold hydrolase [Nevskiales bacterium]